MIDFPRREASMAFTGLCVALAASGGILSERISGGSLRVGFVANVVITLSAIVAFVVTMRAVSTSRDAASGLSKSQVLAQALGGVLGILLVHAVVRGGSVGAPWLSEKPAQLVNDGVVVFAILAVVWGCARNLDPRVLIVALVLVTGYAATAGRWHLDRAPHGFDATVQQFVVAEFVAVALAVAIFRTLVRHDETS
jgi:hypothetical protein